MYETPAPTQIRSDRGGGCRATCPGSAPHTSTVVVEPSRVRAFRLIPTCAGTYGCGSAPDFDRLPPHAAIAARSYLASADTVRAMAWTWRYEDSAGSPVEAAEVPAGEPFPTQSDAETWIGENWRELLSAGVDQVTLLDSGQVVYGPMSLHPAE